MKIKSGNIFKRCCAYLLDIFFCVVVGFSLLILYLKFFTSYDITDFFNLVWIAATVGNWQWLTIAPIYFIWFEQSKWQATLGKKLLKLKVVNFDGSKLSLWKSFARFFLFALIHNVMFILTNYIYSKQIRRLLFDFSTIEAIKMQFIIAPEYAILRLVTIIWFITIIFTKKRTGIYEILSRTKVIRSVYH
ncbi:MAG: RDD family protein [Rickettsiales bacterium]|nr:RDD family protein [Rickettsiales bacterium]